MINMIVPRIPPPVFLPRCGDCESIGEICYQVLLDAISKHAALLDKKNSTGKEHGAKKNQRTNFNTPKEKFIW